MTTLKPLTSSILQPSNPVTLEPLKEGWRWARLGDKTKFIDLYVGDITNA